MKASLSLNLLEARDVPSGAQGVFEWINIPGTADGASRSIYYDGRAYDAIPADQFFALHQGPAVLEPSGYKPPGGVNLRVAGVQFVGGQGTPVGTTGGLSPLGPPPQPAVFQPAGHKDVLWITGPNELKSYQMTPGPKGLPHANSFQEVVRLTLGIPPGVPLTVLPPQPATYQPPGVKDVVWIVGPKPGDGEQVKPGPKPTILPANPNTGVPHHQPSKPKPDPAPQPSVSGGHTVPPREQPPKEPGTTGGPKKDPDATGGAKSGSQPGVEGGSARTKDARPPLRAGGGAAPGSRVNPMVSQPPAGQTDGGSGLLGYAPQAPAGGLASVDVILVWRGDAAVQPGCAGEAGGTWLTLIGVNPASVFDDLGHGVNPGR